jgi:hypothetical protein
MVEYIQEDKQFRVVLERNKLLTEDECIECEQCKHPNHNLKIVRPCSVCGTMFQQWNPRLYTHYCEACAKSAEGGKRWPEKGVR